MNLYKYLFALGSLITLLGNTEATTTQTIEESGSNTPSVNPDVPLFVEYSDTSAHTPHFNDGRGLTASQLEKECTTLLQNAQLDQEDNDSFVCLPVKVADQMVAMLEARDGATVSVSKTAGKTKLLGQRDPVENPDKKKRGLRGTDAESSKTFLFSDPDFESTITGTMVVDQGRVNAVMYGERNVTMIMPCRDTPDPRCHISLTLGAKASAAMQRVENSDQNLPKGIAHRHLAAEDIIVNTIDYVYSPAAAAELGGSKDALLQNALMRMEVVNTVHQNSGLNIRYVLGEVKVADRGFKQAFDALKYGTQTKEKGGSDYLAVIATTNEMLDANGMAWQDCLRQINEKMNDGFSELYQCLVYASRLFVPGYITDAHEMGHLHDGGHVDFRDSRNANSYNGKNFAARAKMDFTGVSPIATALTSGTQDFRFPIYSQKQRLYRGKAVGDPEHQNAQVIGFRTKQVHQTLHNLPVDPDPVPVCEPYVVAAKASSAVLKAIPGDLQHNVISFVSNPKYDRKITAGFKLNLMTNKGMKTITIAYESWSVAKTDINVYLDTTTMSPFNIEFKDKTHAIIHYTAVGPYGSGTQVKLYPITLRSGEEFNGQVKLSEPKLIPNFFNILCQTGFAPEAGSAPTPAPSNQVTNPPVTSKQPTPMLTKAPVRSPTKPVTTNTPAPTASTWDTTNGYLVSQVQQNFNPLPKTKIQERVAEVFTQSKMYLDANLKVLVVIEAILKKQPGVELSNRCDGMLANADSFNRYLNVLDTIAAMDETRRDKFLAELDKWQDKRKKLSPALMQVKKALAIGLDVSLKVGSEAQIAGYLRTKGAAKADFKNNLLWRVAQTMLDADAAVKAATPAPTVKKPRG